MISLEVNSENANHMVITQKENSSIIILRNTHIYEITVLLLRKLRFPEIRTCETADGMGWVITLCLK